jgi:hypothetical protein
MYGCLKNGTDRRGNSRRRRKPVGRRDSFCHIGDQSWSSHNSRWSWVPHSGRASQHLDKDRRGNISIAEEAIGHILHIRKKLQVLAIEWQSQKRRDTGRRRQGSHGRRRVSHGRFEKKEISQENTFRDSAGRLRTPTEGLCEPKASVSCYFYLFILLIFILASVRLFT